MTETNVKAVETWSLGELLRALCQVAQDAGGPENVLQPAEPQHFVHELRAIDQRGSGT